jgi:8-oxo-dGTP pyrophosphatase MutT (NUDIX family)
MSAGQERPWKPNVTVAAIIEHDGCFLMVEEETRQGIRLNQPAGHLEAGESLIHAVCRETLEETAHPLTPGWLVGIYQLTAPENETSYLRFAFAGRAQAALPDRKLDTGILRAIWLTLAELRACTDRHRSPLVMQCVEDYLSGRRYPLELVRYYSA